MSLASKQLNVLKLPQGGPQHAQPRQWVWALQRRRCAAYSSRGGRAWGGGYDKYEDEEVAGLPGRPSANPAYDHARTNRERKQVDNRQREQLYGPHYADTDVRLYLAKRRRDADKLRRRGGFPFDDSFERPETYLKLGEAFRAQVLKERCEALADFLRVDEATAQQLYTALPGLMCFMTLEVAFRIRGLGRALQLHPPQVICMVCALPELALTHPDAVESRVGLLAHAIQLPRRVTVELMLQHPSLLYMNSRQLLHRMEELALLLGASHQDAAVMIANDPPLLDTPLESLTQRAHDLAAAWGVATGSGALLPLLQGVLDMSPSPADDENSRQLSLLLRADAVALLERSIGALASVLGISEVVARGQVLRAPELLGLGSEELAAAVKHLAGSWLCDGTGDTGRQEGEEGHADPAQDPEAANRWASARCLALQHPGLLVKAQHKDGLETCLRDISSQLEEQLSMEVAPTSTAHAWVDTAAVASRMTLQQPQLLLMGPQLHTASNNLARQLSVTSQAVLWQAIVAAPGLLLLEQGEVQRRIRALVAILQLPFLEVKQLLAAGNLRLLTHSGQALRRSFAQLQRTLSPKTPIPNTLQAVLTNGAQPSVEPATALQAAAAAPGIPAAVAATPAAFPAAASAYDTPFIGQAAQQQQLLQLLHTCPLLLLPEVVAELQESPQLQQTVADLHAVLARMPHVKQAQQAEGPAHAASIIVTLPGRVRAAIQNAWTPEYSCIEAAVGRGDPAGASATFKPAVQSARPATARSATASRGRDATEPEQGAASWGGDDVAAEAAFGRWMEDEVAEAAPTTRQRNDGDAPPAIAMLFEDSEDAAAKDVPASPVLLGASTDRAPGYIAPKKRRTRNKQQ